jgi:hypothetical protein
MVTAAVLAAYLQRQAPIDPKILLPRAEALAREVVNWAEKTVREEQGDE